MILNPVSSVESTNALSAGIALIQDLEKFLTQTVRIIQAWLDVMNADIGNLRQRESSKDGQMLDFKQTIDELCDYALLHSDVPERFDIHDLSNVTQAFNHVVSNLMWDSSLERDLTAFQATERAVNFGKRLRQLIIDATGLDPHDTFGSVLDEPIIEAENRIDKR